IHMNYDLNSGITGAEVVDDFNLPPYGCSYKLYLQKTGEPEIDPCMIEDEKAVKAKVNHYRDFISQIYTKKTKRRSRYPNQIFVNRDYPFILGDFDMLQTNLLNGIHRYVPLEIRIISPLKFYIVRKEGSPDNYYTYQMTHHMIAKKAKWSSLCMFCPELMSIKLYNYVYDEAIAAEVIKAEREFWATVKAQEPKRPLVDANRQKCMLCGYRHKCWTKRKNY
ncbi:MAG: hypothetical protein PHW83_03840, partial [Bacteroidales bacterium]|nr:hypothetical protein [Bacteroidales bacterium]